MAVQIFANNAFSLLQATIAPGDTAITVSPADAALYPSPSAGDWFILTVEDNTKLEIMKCTGRAAEVLTVVRAQEGTIASAFTAGSRVDMRLTAGAIGNFVQPGTLAAYVLGPLTATDNALVRFDNTTGKLIQDSNATLSDAGNLALVGSVSAASAAIAGALSAGATSVSTFTTSSTVTLSPANANVTISPTGTGTVTINPAVAGAINRMNIGATTPGTGAFTSLAATSGTFTGPVSVSLATGTNPFSMVTADPGASGLFLDWYHNSASPAVSDIITSITLSANSSTGVKRSYGQMYWQITDPTNGTEDSSAFFLNIVNGVQVFQMSMTATGMQIPAIGATTPGTGAFTTLSATGLLDISGAGASQIKFGNANNSANVDTFDGYKDFVASTPTLVGFGTPTGVVYFSKRVGDRLEGYCKFTCGTPTAVEARFPLLLNNVALTSDATKTPSIMLCGYGTYNAVTGVAPTILVESGVTYGTFGFQGAAAGQAGLTKQNGNTFLGAGSIFSFFFSVPISTW